jgi:hypothetical protein
MPDGYPPPGRELATTPPIGRGELYGLIGAARFELRPPPSDSALKAWQHGDVGTVGMLNYLTEPLLLDLANHRLAAIPRTPGLDSILGPAAVILGLERGRYDRAVVPLTGPSGTALRALIDTGLSPFPLWTTRKIWQELTGLLGPGPRTRTYRLRNRRGEMVFVGAKTRARLSLGSWPLQPSEVVYLVSGPASAPIEFWTTDVDVVLGASVWNERGILLIDLTGHRLMLADRLARRH